MNTRMIDEWVHTHKKGEPILGMSNGEKGTHLVDYWYGRFGSDNTFASIQGPLPNEKETYRGSVHLDGNNEFFKCTTLEEAFNKCDELIANWLDTRGIDKYEHFRIRREMQTVLVPIGRKVLILSDPYDIEILLPKGFIALDRQHGKLLFESNDKVLVGIRGIPRDGITSDYPIILNKRDIYGVSEDLAEELAFEVRMAYKEFHERKTILNSELKNSLGAIIKKAEEYINKGEKQCV